MEDSKKPFIQRGLNRILKRIELQNKQSSKINSILVVLTFIAVVVAIVSSLEANKSAESSNRSAQIANNALNETKKLVNWTEPKPNIQIWSDKDFWGKNGTVYLIISTDYSPNIGAKGFIFPKTYSGPITIDFLIFNSGKAPVSSAICYIGLNCSEIKDIFPFKIYNITTPLQSLFYNQDTQEMEQSFMNFVNIPYWQWNERNVLDFPPSYRNSHVEYRNLILPYEYYATRINYTSNQSDWDYRIGSIGPFIIGNILPGETKHVYVSLFSAVSNYNQLSDQYWTSPGPFASGNFTIEIESANCQTEKISFPIESYFHLP
jgi:hypothetical protein